MKGVNLKDHKHNWEIREAVSVVPMDAHVIRRRQQWYEQVRRRGDQEPMQQVLRKRGNAKNKTMANTQSYGTP